MADLITLRRDRDLAQVRLNRPDKLNSLTLDVLEELVEVGRSLHDDRMLRGILIAGEGRAFCAGLDFGTVMQDPARVAAAFVADPRRGTNLFQEACWVWRRLPMPVVAAVHGHCLGGGVQIALAADFRFSTPDATWSVLEAKWGLVPDMTGIQALSQQVGMDVAKRLAMTGEMFTGTRAHELGLVTEVADDPIEAGAALLAQIATRSPDAVAATKRLFNRTWTRGDRATFARERREQARLFTAANTYVARVISAGGEAAYLPRGS